MYLSFKDYIIILCKAIILTIPIILILCILFKLVTFNHSIGIFVADTMEIPYDMSLTMMSLGFVNNITFILSVLEIGFICFVINKISKTKIVRNLISNF